MGRFEQAIYKSGLEAAKYRYNRYLDNIGITDILQASPIPIIRMHPIKTSTQLGAHLTGRRKQLKLSQTDVAQRLSLSQNRLSELESRPETLTVEQLLALLNVLGLEMTLRDPPGGKPKAEW